MTQLFNKKVRKKALEISKNSFSTYLKNVLLYRCSETVTKSSQRLAVSRFSFFFYYRSIRIIDNGASSHRTRNARFRARRADHLHYL